MGFWDSIIGSGKPAAPAAGAKTSNPFNVTIAFAPLRLSAKAKSSVNLLVKVTNTSASPQLVSVDALLPKDAMLGFDPACINKAAEKRAGELKAGGTIEVAIPLWSSNQTKEGNYPVEVTVFSHYINYEKVLSYIKKSTAIRV
ncbi:hypothetical protein H0O00_02895, partial [Candidatus Micrarchaeota archaeon]|nr:hypothetical protein [Candidatus Micrarchaeota archaeon]